MNIAQQCLDSIRAMAGRNPACDGTVSQAEAYFARKKRQLDSIPQLALLDGEAHRLWVDRDDFAARLEAILQPEAQPDDSQPSVPLPGNSDGAAPAAPKTALKSIYRQSFPARTLKSEAEIDAYADEIRGILKKMLQDCDGIRID